jgi:hypothetical protein
MFTQGKHSGETFGSGMGENVEIFGRLMFRKMSANRLNVRYLMICAHLGGDSVGICLKGLKN